MKLKSTHLIKLNLGRLNLTLIVKQFLALDLKHILLADCCKARQTDYRKEINLVRVSNSRPISINVTN